MKILITGAFGMLGKDVSDVFRRHGHEVIATDRAELDITKEGEVMEFIRAHQPEVVINTAAYNFVDNVEQAEIYPIAYAINTLGPSYLASACKSIGATFIHFSTDYVFAGTKEEGYTESDERNPISQYGKTKAEGERLVEEVGGNYLIFRLSKIFGAPGISDGSKESFVALMLRLAREKPELAIVNEEVGCPTYTKDIAERVYELTINPIDSGIYHLVNSGKGVTWYEFAEEFFAIQKSNTPRKPVTSAEFPKPAKRPKFAALINTKLPPMRSRQVALQEFLATLSA